jgi:hypothetical protein
MSSIIKEHIEKAFVTEQIAGKMKQTNQEETYERKRIQFNESQVAKLNDVYSVEGHLFKGI